jgi:hypothetical protein
MTYTRSMSTDPFPFTHSSTFHLVRSASSLPIPSLPFPFTLQSPFSARYSGLGLKTSSSSPSNRDGRKLKPTSLHRPIFGARTARTKARRKGAEPSKPLVLVTRSGAVIVHLLRPCIGCLKRCHPRFLRVDGVFRASQAMDIRCLFTWYVLLFLSPFI